TDSEPLCASRKENSASGSTSCANAAAACIVASGEPEGTENSVASCEPANAAGTTIASAMAAILRTCGAPANQSGGVERKAERRVIFIGLSKSSPLGLVCEALQKIQLDHDEIHTNG